MPTIEVDPDVLEAIKGQALPWVDSSPSDTLRRLLGLNGEQERAPLTASIGNGAGAKPRPASTGATPSGRQRKVDLWTLQQAGFLVEGQALHLRDYSGKPVPGADATVGPVNKLVMNGRRSSMSLLASRLLKRAGYAAHSVRGPAHWFTADGVSVLDLWKRYAQGGHA
jgi:hypothetical protein